MDCVNREFFYLGEELFAIIVPSNLLPGEGRRSRKHCEWEWTTNVKVLVAERKGVDEV